MATPAEIKAAKIEEFRKAKASDAEKGAQKAKILARRDQLLATGYDAASALQVAFDEVSGKPGEFAKRVEAKAKVVKPQEPRKKHLTRCAIKPLTFTRTMIWVPASRKNVPKRLKKRSRQRKPC